MKLQRFIPILLAGLILACNPNTSEQPLGEFETGILISNEGAFGANDGEVFHFEPSTEVLKPNVFETVNGRPFAGLLQSMVKQEGRMYLVANTGKVEIVSPKDFKSIGAVVDDLVQPRSAATNGNKLYIADWGPFDENFNNPDSYIAVVNSLDGGAVSKKIPVPSRPESVFADGNFLYVANQAARKLTIISTSADQIVGSEDVIGTPERLQIINGRLYLYARDASKIYFHEINRGNQRILGTKSFDLPNATASFAVGESNDIYVVTSSGWPDYNDAVSRINMETERVVNATWHVGSGFYGIGYDADSKEVFVANHAGFTGNGTVNILDANGQEIKKLNVGRGPNGFMIN